MRTILLMCMVVACSKSADKAPAPAPAFAPAPVVPEAKPAAVAPPAMPAVTGLFTCKPGKPAQWQLPFKATDCPAIPSLYGAVQFGMSRADVKKIIHGARIEDGYGGGWVGYIYLNAHGVRRQFAYQFSGTDKLEEIAFDVEQDGFDQLKSAWGTPITYEDLSDHVLAWFDPNAKIKALAEASQVSHGDQEVPGYHVRIKPYSPEADLMSKTGVIAQSFVGKSLKELAASYPDTLEVKTAKQSEAELKALKLDDAVVKFAAGDSAALHLPESETNNGVFVQFEWDGQLKVTRYSLSFPFGKDNKVRDEILAEIAVALDKPVAAKADDHGVVNHFTFAGAQDRRLVIDVEPSILGDSWEVAVHGK